jgi:excisionase family DNA binding protein
VLSPAAKPVALLLGLWWPEMGSGTAGEVYEGSLPSGLANLFRQLDGSKSLSMEIRTVRAQYVAALREGDGMAQEWCLEMLIKLVKADPGVDSSSFNTWTAEVGREITARQNTEPPSRQRSGAPVGEASGAGVALPLVVPKPGREKRKSMPAGTTADERERQPGHPVTVGAAAQMLGVSRRQVNRMLQAGVLTSTVGGDRRKRLIPISEIEARLIGDKGTV